MAEILKSKLCIYNKNPPIFVSRVLGLIFVNMRSKQEVIVYVMNIASPTYESTCTKSSHFFSEAELFSYDTGPCDIEFFQSRISRPVLYSVVYLDLLGISVLHLVKKIYRQCPGLYKYQMDFCVLFHFQQMIPYRLLLVGTWRGSGNTSCF